MSEKQQKIERTENEKLKSKMNQLLDIRETLGDVLYQPMDETDKEMYTDAAFNMVDKLIKELEGADE